MKNVTYAVIGTGAIGGYYGAKLAKVGKDVNFLFHRDYEYVKEHGLQVNSCNGDFHIERVNAFCDSRQMPRADVIIVGLKTVKEELVGELVKPILKPSSIVILFQNGIGVEEDVQRMLPEVQLVAGLAFICSGKTKPGVVDHQFFGSINLGAYSIKDRELLETIKADLKEAGVETNEMDYAEARWKKAVWNMPFNGMSVVMRAKTDLLIKTEIAETMIRGLMNEVVGAAEAIGVKNVGQEHVEKMISMTKAMVPYSPSMKLDYEHKRPMEIEYLYTRPIAMAKAAGYRMPRMEMLEAQLRMLEQADKDK